MQPVTKADSIATLGASVGPTPVMRWRNSLREIGAAFLCADLGITPETREDHAAYITSWLQVLKNDKRAIFTAASHAQKAADYLNSLQPQA